MATQDYGTKLLLGTGDNQAIAPRQEAIVVGEAPVAVGRRMGPIAGGFRSDSVC